MARMVTILVALLLLLGGVVAATGAAAGIAFMAAPLERAVALDSRAYAVVHGELRRQEAWRDVEWRIAGVDAAPMASGEDDLLAERRGREVIGLVHDDELVALELPDGQRVVRSEVGWTPVWTMAVLVLLALVVATGAFGYLTAMAAGRLPARVRGLPAWVRGAVVTAPFVVAGVVLGHLRSAEMLKVDLAVVAPMVALLVTGCVAGPRWYAAARAYASQDPLAQP